jgi:hypothetical protein
MHHGLAFMKRKGHQDHKYYKILSWRLEEDTRWVNPGSKNLFLAMAWQPVGKYKELDDATQGHL